MVDCTYCFIRNDIDKCLYPILLKFKISVLEIEKIKNIFILSFNLIAIYSIPANMRQWVYCSGLRQGSSSDFDFFWNEFLKEDLANNAVIMIGAAGCTNDVGSLEKFLDAIITVNNSAEIIRPQDNSAAWSSAVTGNNANPMRMLNWLRRNVNLFIERYLLHTTTLYQHIYVPK